MEQPQWRAFEACFDDYLKQNFLQSSAKRDTEFDTIWEIASQEGAKMHLNNFKATLEAEAARI